jgi:hemerythrin-like domain-containing protein
MNARRPGPLDVSTDRAYIGPMSTTGFLDELMRAHAMLETRLQGLSRAADALSEPGRASSALDEMTRLLEFVSTFGAQHQEDEERTLFPRLRALGDLGQMLDAYEFQHRMADDEHRAVVAALAAFAPGQEPKLRELVLRFVEVHRSHMLAEERALFPMVERRLPAHVLAAMSRELRVPSA